MKRSAFWPVFMVALILTTLWVGSLRALKTDLEGKISRLEKDVGLLEGQLRWEEEFVNDPLRTAVLKLDPSDLPKDLLSEITGLVTLDGHPMPYPEVQVYEPDMRDMRKVIHLQPDSLISREDGNYTVRNLPPGRYLLKVHNQSGGSYAPYYIVHVKAGTTIQCSFDLHSHL